MMLRNLPCYLSLLTLYLQTIAATAPLHLLRHRHISTFTPSLYSATTATAISAAYGVDHHEISNSSNRASASAFPAQPSILNISYDTLFFTQSLDHFSFTPVSYTTFQQRYLLSTAHWGGAAPLSPIFVYCGNEGDIEWFAQNTGFLWELAPIYNAMVVFPEHRFYGQSIPDFAVENRTRETLGYLTSEQALADYAVLISDLKKNYSAEDCPVVVFGGSYGGMLAAWFRLKYPHIAIGALASSAPILEFDNLVPNDGFYRTVSENYKNVSRSCFETIKASWDALDTASEIGGMENVSKLFKFCDNNTLDVGSAQGFLFTALVYMAMTNYPYAANFLAPMPGNPVKVACEAIDSFPRGTDVLTRVAAGVNVYYNGTGQVQCFNNSVNSDTHGLALWNWQVCTEMVMPLSSNPDNSLFPAFNYTLEGTIEECLQELGVSPRPHWITQEYGGRKIRSVLKRFASNIVFSNGRLDPWSTGGVLEDISKTVVALVTAKGAHHLDLRASTPADPEWLRWQRTEERKHINRWLHKYYSDMFI